MKRLLLLLLILPFMACSDDDKEATQDHTSFVFIFHAKTTLDNCVVGYKQSNGDYKKIADLGELKQDIPSKEVSVNGDITEVYFFHGTNVPTRLDAVYPLKKDIKNTLILSEDTRGVKVNNINDPKEYPQ